MARSTNVQLRPFLFLVHALVGIVAPSTYLCDAKHPRYPLAALGGEALHNKAVPLPTADDIKTIAESFDYLHGEYTSNWLQLMHETRPGMGVVQYINSHIASAKGIENTHGGRLSTIYYCTGWLDAEVSEKDTELDILLDNKHSPLIASTSAGNVSTKDEYVTYLRLENELAKIVSVESPRHKVSRLAKANGTIQKVTVLRGFDGTSPAAHSKNMSVLGPSYKNYPGQQLSENWLIDEASLWKSEHGNGLPGEVFDRNDSPITYDIDPASGFASAVLINFTLQAVSAGYNGSWFDCFSDHVLKATDVGGRPVHGDAYWNFATKASYTAEEFSNAQRKRLQAVFESVHATLGFFPLILANNVGASYFTYGRSFLIPGPGDFRPLDAYDLEAFAGTLQATKPGVNSCSGPPEDFVVEYKDPDGWLRNIQLISNASQSNLSLIAMMSSAGCESFPMEGMGEQRTQLQHFAYASYLLAATGPSTRTHFGIPAYYQANGTRFVHIDDWFYLDIGTPTETYPPAGVTKYQPAGHASFVRQFTKGVVVVNPTNTTDEAVPLGNSYHYPLVGVEAQGNAVSNVTMTPHTGLLMLYS
ncbi:uncharacterized protein LOC135809881 [Sycon ciliatum]|uniref:uncharacterized protein LOC135809881 n=1 Tax=Sycon ciliatum TaxID=27933 RepID=UPI0020AB57F0|eukprot:scpid26290/ scgid29213/ 